MAAKPGHRGQMQEEADRGARQPVPVEGAYQARFSISPIYPPSIWSVPPCALARPLEHESPSVAPLIRLPVTRTTQDPPSVPLPVRGSLGSTVPMSTEATIASGLGFGSGFVPLNSTQQKTLHTIHLQHERASSCLYHVYKNHKVEIFNYSERSGLTLHI